MSFLGGENVKLLKKLFNPRDEENESASEDESNAGGPQFGPGDIGQRTAKKPVKKEIATDEHVQSCTYARITETVTEQPQTLEEWEERQLTENGKILDTRQRPDYRITYKQTVATEDIYLQLNAKTSATASCESMVLEVFLSEETVGIQHIELTVKPQQVTVSSPRYHLDLALPHRIDPDKGNAAWLSDERTLKLTLRMEREFDFVNF